VQYNPAPQEALQLVGFVQGSAFALNAKIENTMNNKNLLFMFIINPITNHCLIVKEI
jgi:hypothetical protein